MPELLSGYDTSFFHFADHSPVHTLKCLVLDTWHRGSPITLGDVRSAVAPRLGLHPRSRQRAMRSRTLPGRYRWVDDPDFDLDNHLAELRLQPGETLDDVCGRLAGAPLDLGRPLWHAVLVHGLPDGRQAVVLRIHHAVTDGVGAANCLRLFTSEQPGEPIPQVDPGPWTPPPIPDEHELRRIALATVPSWLRNVSTYVSETVAGHRDRAEDARLIRARDDLIGLRATATYGWTAARFGRQRVCASGSLPLEAFREVKAQHGVTLNDVLVAVIGVAMVEEARHRGAERDDDDEVAMFSIALDTDPARLCGNEIMAISVPMHTKEDDLAARLQAIHRTCGDQIRLTRRQQRRRSVRITDLWARSIALGARVFAYRIPAMTSNVVMANVPASPTTRWFGDVEVVDFVSYAVLIQPIGLNVTVYSYDGRMSFGVLSAPEVIDDPHRMIRRFGAALERFRSAVPA